MRLIGQAANLPFVARSLLTWLLFVPAGHAGGQIYVPLSASVRAVLQRSVSDQAESKLSFASQYESETWLAATSRRLQKFMPDARYRMDFLRTEYYEASRAGLDPEIVLGLIEVESKFNKYAVSKVGARGYMQVMPFWVAEIGTKEHNLFHLRVNLRYGCTILRYYLDVEKGNLFRALARYNGTLGRPEYPNMVRAAWRDHWASQPHKAGSFYISAG